MERMSTSIRVFAFVVLLMLAGTSVAQEDWRRQSEPAGAPVNTIAMWGDSGIAIGPSNWLTADDGKSWKGSLVATLYTSSLEPDGRGWVVTYIPGMNGLYYTSNYGHTWDSCPFPYPAGTHLWRVVGTAPGHRLALVRDDAFGNMGIYESADPDFTTWKQIPFSGLPTDARGNEIIYNPVTKSLVLSFMDATGFTAVFYRSTDMGSTWSPMPLTGIPADAIPTTSQVLWATAAGIEFMATRTAVGNESQWMAYRSSDDGSTWKPVTSGLPPFMTLNFTAQRPTGELYATVARVAPANNEIWFASVYKSLDSGVTWAELPNVGLPTGIATYITVTPRGTLLVAGNPGSGGGLFRSTDDGATWIPSVKGMNDPFVMSIASDTKNRRFVMAPNEGLFRYQRTDGWKRLTNGIPSWGWKNICIGKNDVVFVADTGGGVYRSTDHGDTWTSISNGLANLHNYVINVSRAGSVLLCTFGGVYRSTDNGDSWSVSFGTIPEGIVVQHLGVRSDGLLVASTDIGPYTSSDDGDTWTLQINGLVAPDCHGVGFCKDGTILLGNGTTIVRSTDDGETWESAANGIIQRDNAGSEIFYQFALRENGRIIATRFDSLFLYASFDNGKTWFDGRTGIWQFYARIRIFCLSAAPDDSLFAGTSYGFWAAGGARSAVDDPADGPSGIALSVSGPNPTGDQTGVQFTLAQAGTVRLSLVDAAGRTIWERSVPCSHSGTHIMSVPTASLPNGIYHCLLHTKTGVATTEIVVER
jgi:photosystem II stability/assembly factor-like uncharacterized protein